MAPARVASTLSHTTPQLRRTRLTLVKKKAPSRSPRLQVRSPHGETVVALPSRRPLHPILDFMLDPVAPITPSSVAFERGRKVQGRVDTNPVERGSGDCEFEAHLLLRYVAHLNTPVCRGSIRMQHTGTTLSVASDSLR